MENERRVTPWPPGAQSSGRRWKLSHDHSNNGKVTFITNKYDVFYDVMNEMHQQIRKPRVERKLIDQGDSFPEKEQVLRSAWKVKICTEEEKQEQCV